MGLPTRKAYLKFLESQLGTHEVPDGSNRQKYGVAYGMNGVAWCQEFDWYVAWKMGLPHLKTASTMAAVADARKKGTWHNGLAGINLCDSIYFHWTSSTRAKTQPDHVESVRRLLKDGSGKVVGVETIGGNVGNGVHRQNRRANILGYIRHEFAPEPKPITPKPAPAPKPKPTPAATIHGVIKKETPLRVRDDVKDVQRALNIFRTHDLLVDGKFWDLTKEAVRDFQGDHHLAIDGEVGEHTAAALGLHFIK